MWELLEETQAAMAIPDKLIRLEVLEKPFLPTVCPITSISHLPPLTHTQLTTMLGRARTSYRKNNARTLPHLHNTQQ